MSETVNRATPVTTEDPSSTLRARYAAHVDQIGRSRELRRFIAAVVVGGRSGILVQRRISAANDAYFKRFAAANDALLEVLREPGWELLDPLTEEGLATVNPVCEWTGNVDARTLADEQERERDRWFRSLYVAWSRLAPHRGRTVHDWPKPRRILLAMGAHIGIGDELICFRVARRLKRTFPDAHIEALSFYPSLWDLSPDVTPDRAAADDPLLPLARACRLMAEDPDALVVFVDYATFIMYRSLELLPALPRFVFIDPGAPVLRLVDNAAGWIAEYRIKGVQRLYRSLGGLLDQAFGRDITCCEGHEPAILSAPPARRERPLIYVNPFSSKEYHLLSPAWWGDSIRRVAAQLPIDVCVFAGINDVTRGVARDIAARVAEDETLAGRVNVTLHGPETPPSIADTLRAAAEADLVLGLDTFTCHVGVLAKVPCVTIYFTHNFRHYWHVPDNAVLAAHVWDTPDTVGDLALRLLRPHGSTALTALAAASDEAARATSLDERIKTGPPVLDAIDALIAEGDDPAWRDLPRAVIDDLRACLTNMRRADQITRETADDTVTNAFDTLLACNAVRYADYVETAASRAARDAG